MHTRCKLVFLLLCVICTLHTGCVQADQTSITDLKRDTANDQHFVITWTEIAQWNYDILWTDSVHAQPQWDKVEYPGITDDVVENGNGTRSWTDKGTDPEMKGSVPASVNARFYKIVSMKNVKYIILVIGDGMQKEYEIAASRYLYGTDDGLTWDQFPYSAYVSTWDVATYGRYAWSLSKDDYTETTFITTIGYDPAQGGSAPFPIDTSGNITYFSTKLPKYGGTSSSSYPAPDSASTATALATGVKTDEGNISWFRNDPANGNIMTIAEKMRQRKNASIGVVSTQPFSHATPAAFVSHNPNRNNYYTGYKGYTGVGIADEIITVTKPDVVIGGGHPLLNNPAWDTTKGFISQQVYNDLLQSTDYVLAERQAGVDGSVTLSNAMNTARTGNKKLFGLFGGAGGYFEHPVASDTPGTPSVTQGSTENPSLAGCASAALTLLSADNDGFFLMVEQGDIDSANHEHNYKWMIGSVCELEETVSAILAFVNQPGDDMDWTNTLLVVTADHGNGYMRLTDSPKLGKGDLPSQQGSSSSWTYPDGEVTYNIPDHTNELVMIYAIGNASTLFSQYEGTWYPGTRIIDNTHIYKTLRQAIGLEE